MHIQTRSAQIVVECRTLIDSSSQGTPCKTQSAIRPRQLGRGCNYGHVRVSLVDDNPNRKIGTGWGKVDRFRARRRVGWRGSGSYMASSCGRLEAQADGTVGTLGKTRTAGGRGKGHVDGAMRYGGGSCRSCSPGKVATCQDARDVRA